MRSVARRAQRAALTRAALIYQHRTTHRDGMIADAISERVKAELKPSGTP